MVLNTADIITELGGMEKNDLIKILDLKSNDTDYNNLFASKQSDYYDFDGTKQFLEKNRGKLTVLSLNAQSINAKFNEILSLLNFLHENKVAFDIICIQEAWLTNNSNYELFHINNYNLFFQGCNPECSTRGGLLTYVCNELSAQITLQCNTFKTWEGLFIEININDTNLTVGNIYRPPHTDHNRFFNEFFPVLTTVHSTSKNVILAGDFNIDLLKASSNNISQQFYDTIVTKLLLIFHLILKLVFMQAIQTQTTKTGRSHNIT